MVMRQVAVMGAIGLAIGLPAAWAASRLVEIVSLRNQGR
jgi:hypothetical protein